MKFLAAMVLHSGTAFAAESAPFTVWERTTVAAGYCSADGATNSRLGSAVGSDFWSQDSGAGSCLPDGSGRGNDGAPRCSCR